MEHPCPNTSQGKPCCAAAWGSVGVPRSTAATVTWCLLPEARGSRALLTSPGTHLTLHTKHWCCIPPSYCSMGGHTPLGADGGRPSILKGQSVRCSPLQPGSTTQHCRPPHYSLGLSGTGNTPPCAGAQAQHVLLGAAALVIGTVIAMSNHTLPRLPREHPRKARSVPLSALRGEGGTEPRQLLSSLRQGN